MSKVYVITNIEHGWDCVESVFSVHQKALDWIKDYCKDCSYPEDIFMIHERVLDED